MTQTLFDDLSTCSIAPQNTERQAELHQWFTPAWAAEAIIEQEFGWLKTGHRVIEPTCGDGAFLCSIPAHIEAIGIDIDPVQASLARHNSGRTVLVGDFLELDLERIGRADAIIGNPPFEAAVIAKMLARSDEILVEGGQVGFILPAYILQTSSKVESLSKSFSIHQQLLPRNLFPRLKLPLVFARFVKEQHRRLFGFLLYREAQELRQLHKTVQQSVSAGRDRRGAWFQSVRTALASLGGEADLQRIYEVMAKARPTENPFWKEKVRQVLQRESDFSRTGPGRYALPI
jgi:adenine-specific DNA-methyltransferase